MDNLESEFDRRLLYEKKKVSTFLPRESEFQRREDSRDRSGIRAGKRMFGIARNKRDMHIRSLFHAGRDTVVAICFRTERYLRLNVS